MSADKRWSKDFVTVCRRLADPPESFQHRQQTHSTIRLVVGGKQLGFTCSKTPSCPRSFDNMMQTFSKVLNDNDITPDDKIFRGKRKFKAAYRRYNKKVANN